MKQLRILFVIFLVWCVVPLSARVKSTLPDAAKLEWMLKRLTVVGNVLYVGAHPDDESTGVLCYLSLGRNLRAAYLALNRGEGGQNLIGPEQGSLLGLIRTQELLAARRIDFASQFFTRAVDFGYSKTEEESLRIWGQEDVLSDVVWIYRKFRPDVVITRFPPGGGGHGHHKASALLAQLAFEAAADPKRFPDQLKFVSTWQPKRVVWNRYSWGPNQEPSEEEKASLVELPVGDYNPLFGYSYTELAGIARSMHKSQGFGDSQDRGRSRNYFKLIIGKPAKDELFEGIDLTWKRIVGGEKIGEILEKTYLNFDPENPSASIPSLLEAYREMKSLESNPWVREKQEEVQDAIRAAAGLWLEAISDEPTGVAGHSVKITTTAVNRSDYPLTLQNIEIFPSDDHSEVNQNLHDNEPVAREFTVPLGSDLKVSQPYWLENGDSLPFAKVSDRQLIGLPESPAAIRAKFYIRAGQEELVFEEPLFHRRVDPVQGEVYTEFRIVPEVSVNLNESILVFADSHSRDLTVTLTGGVSDVSGEVGLQVPENWNVSPVSAPFDLKNGSQSTIATFKIQPSKNATSGDFEAIVSTGSGSSSLGRIEINYPHIPLQMYFPPAKGKLVKIDLARDGENLGYVRGSGDAIPDSLTQIGYRITELQDEDLLSMNLKKFDAVILGVRAYNTRPELRSVQDRLMEYVEQGGTLVVQYNTLQELVVENLGPYPFKISRERVSVEDSPVEIISPEHPVLNWPNKITEKDFEGWVQERGLYFPNDWDQRYETVLSSADPGESQLAGGVLVAHYGKGIYIYTSYSWFRQLPAGVPGAYRLFVNLISAGKGPVWNKNN